MSSSETSSTPTEPGRPGGVTPRTLVLIALLAIGLIVVGLLAYPSSPSTSSTAGVAREGQAVPHFSLPPLDGTSKVAVPADGGGNGRPAVLVFWASWCEPCQAEMTPLATAVREGKAGDAVVLGINALDAVGPARTFVQAHDMTFPSGFDANGSVTNGAFGFQALPEVVFVNSKGLVTQIHYGVTTPAELEAGVKGLG